MRGYELVLYANAALLLLICFLSLTYGIVLTVQGPVCEPGTSACAAGAALGHRALQVAPWLGAIGTLLAGSAVTLTLHRLGWTLRSLREENV